jgi:hypothetical protein
LSPLGRDVAIILAVKFAALVLLWWAFFSHPVARHMTIEASQVEAHLAGNPAPGESTNAAR